MSTILVIDDQPVSLQILAAIAASINSDIEVKTFPCPRQALDWVNSNNFVALVITDYKMPEMNGIEFIRLFRESPCGAGVPAILVSADLQPEVRQAAMEAGVNDFLEKPINHNDCRERCRELLGHFT